MFSARRIRDGLYAGMRRRLILLALLAAPLAVAAAALVTPPGASAPTASAQILPTPTATLTPLPTITVTPTPTPTSSATPTPAPTETAPPPPPPSAAPAGPPQSEVLVPELASDGFTSPRMALRWRGRGDDDARAAGFFVDVRQVGLRAPADWRALVTGAAARTTVFTGAPGEAYTVRVRARDEGSSDY